MAHPDILAAVVNHNTSAYTELMARSLFALHQAPLRFSLTIFDNHSSDDSAPLRAFAERMGVPFKPSPWELETEYVSHGDVLRDFVLANPHCDYYLFLDADVVFLQAETIPNLLRELESAPDAFGIGPTMSWDGLQPMPEPLDNPDIYAARLHPCCALIKNTHLFRRVVQEIGLGCAQLLWPDRAEYLDTFKLMTKVMKTHGMRHIISSQMVLHFFCTSYAWDSPELKESKMARRDALLAKFREEERQG